MKELLPDDMAKVKKLIFQTYYSILCYKGSKKLSFSFSVVGLMIRQIQLLSVHLNYLASVKFYSSSRLFIKFLSILRLDIVLVSLNQNKVFLIFSLIVVLSSILAKVSISLQLYYKRNFCFDMLIILSNTSSWILLTLLQIPFNFYAFDYIKGCVTNTSELYSGSFINYEAIYIPVFLISYFCILLETCLHTLFCNLPKYSNKSTSRIHSLVQIHELLCISALGPALFFLSSEYFTYLYLFISIFQLYKYFYYLPYTCNILNQVCIQTWSSVLISSILVLLSKFYQNYYIFELNFPIVYFAMIFINKASITKRLALSSSSQDPSPYEHELKLRNFVVNGEQIKAEIIFEHFKFGTQNFPNFNLQYIWESILIKKHVKDVHLALMKLVKINTCKYAESNKVIYSITQKFYYPHEIEVEFMLFSLFNKFMASSNKESNVDLALIKYYSYFNKISEFDESILIYLLDFTSSLERNSDSKVIKKRIEKIGTLIKNYNFKAKKMIEKFGADTKFVKLYCGFLINILKSEDGHRLLKTFGLENEQNLEVINEESDLVKSTPLLVISGWYKNIGKILFANPAMFTLLKISNENQLIGTSFTKLIPKPFDTMHDYVLFRYLFNRNSTELTRSNLFLIDSDNHCIEVTMQFTLAFYKRNPYFIAYFNVINSEKLAFLCSLEGEVYSYSEGAKEIVPSVESNIYLTFPDIEDYLRRLEFGTKFEFNVSGEFLNIEKTRLKIDGYEMMVLYFSKFKNKVEGSKIKRKENDGAKECSGNFFKKKSMGKELILKKTIGIEEYSKPDTIKLKQSQKNAKILNWMIKILLITEFIIAFTILIVILYIIQTLSVNSIISNIGMMRYLSTSILSNVQSLDLLSENYQVAYTESYYKSNIKNNSQLLKSLLEDYRIVTLPFLNQEKQYFTDTKIKMFKLLNSSYVEEELTILNSIQDIITKALKISESQIDKSEIEKMELFRNIPCNYIIGLQLTINNIIQELNESLGKLFEYLEYLEMVCLIPPLGLFIISSYLLYIIEKSNKQFWRIISSLNRADLIEMQTSITDRLNFIHNVEHINESSPDTNQKKTKYSITTLPLIKIFGLLLIVTCFYVSLTLGPQTTLFKVFRSSLVHTNKGGMRRMLTPLTLYWSRESLLDASNHTSYTQKIPSYEISYSFEELKNNIKRLKNIQSVLMTNLNNPDDKRYNYGPYFNLMLGNACDLIENIENCSESIISKGVDNGMKVYLNELESFYWISKSELKNGNLIEVEKYSKDVEKSFVYGLSVYGNYTDTVLNRLKQDMVITTVFFIILSILYFIVFLNQLASKVIEDIENKDKILDVFATKNKTQIQKNSSKLKETATIMS